MEILATLTTSSFLNTIFYYRYGVFKGSLEVKMLVYFFQT